MAADRYKYFRIEGRELLDQLSTGVLALEREGYSGDLLDRLLRFAHTLKGAARVVKQPEIARLAHEVEDLLTPLQDNASALPRERLDTVLALLDGIGGHIRSLSLPQEIGAHPVADEFFRTLRTDVAEVDALLSLIAASQARAGGLRRTADSLAQARRLAAVVAEGAGTGATRSSDAITGASGDLRALLVDLEGRLAGEAQRLERELHEVRGAGERLRLLPVNTLFGPLGRAVRDAGGALGKVVSFNTEGGDIRLDGHVLQALQGALLHVVRNSVAHGIESAGEREAAGKPALGAVVLKVVRRGPRVGFVCRDDGRGIDLAAVRQALQRKGLFPAGTEAPGREELLRLLLESRVSTSNAVTDLSGRGVGLDVVRETATQLGGQVALESEQGAGTTLDIEVPVSLSSLEALLVEAGGATAALPLDAVRGTLRLARADISGSPDGDAIPYGEALVPFAPLSRLLGRDDHDAPAARSSVVVFSGRSASAAIGVDRLLAVATVLVRALPAFAPAASVVAGVSIDTWGRPQPVLDPEHLAEAVRQTRRAALRKPAPRAPILVVDDSLTTRMLEQSILESAGYTVDLATSAEEALDKARRHRYGLFLVDVEMPGMDGFELLERFQGDPELQGIPSILVTSRGAPEDRKRGVQVGARAYVVKSEFDQVDLLKRIEALIQ